MELTVEEHYNAAKALILEAHQRWMEGEPDGVQLDLRGADLRGADLRGADLTVADLRGAYLRKAALSAAVLREANLGAIK